MFSCHRRREGRTHRRIGIYLRSVFHIPGPYSLYTHLGTMNGKWREDNPPAPFSSAPRKKPWVAEFTRTKTCPCIGCTATDHDWDASSILITQVHIQLFQVLHIHGRRGPLHHELRVFVECADVLHKMRHGESLHPYKHSHVIR